MNHCDSWGAEVNENFDDSIGGRMGASELESLQARVAAEMVVVEALRDRVAQVEVQRDELERDLAIVRAWIDEMQRSESLRIGKVLTAPGRLVKRFVP